MRKFLSLLVVSLTLFAAPLARAADGEGTTTVRAANQTLQSLLKKGAAPGSSEEKKLTEELNTKLRGFLDIDELGKRALGENAKKFSAEELAEFTRLLREIVEGNYLRALRSQLEFEVNYLKETNEGKTLRVATTVKTKAGKDGPARTIDIDYVLHKDGGSLRVFDLVTDGIGLVENYKSQFNRIIAKEGAAGLLTRMRKKTVKD
ncbi:MAG TPA: ABC transporter substrate-binding protein [Polyangiaceae bacterium]